LDRLLCRFLAVAHVTAETSQPANGLGQLRASFRQAADGLPGLLPGARQDVKDRELLVAPRGENRLVLSFEQLDLQLARLDVERRAFQDVIDSFRGLLEVP